MASQDSDILQSFDGTSLSCETVTHLLRGRGEIGDSVEVSKIGVVPGSELRWPQSHSAKLDLELRDGSPGGTGGPRIFPMYLKKVLACNMPARKRLVDLRRDLLSNRNEARFYREFAPILARRGVRLLQCFLADDNFCDADDADASDGGVPRFLGDEGQLRQRGVLFLLERADRFTQASPLSEGQALASLSLLATLHAQAWEDQEMLAAARRRLHPTACYWSLSKRGLGEMGQMAENWRQYLTHFTPLAPQLLGRPGIGDLAHRLERVAPWVAEQLAPEPGDCFATLVHGDYKAMNIFFGDAEPSEVVQDACQEAEEEMAAVGCRTAKRLRTDRAGLIAAPIDFQWTGLGYGMSDVAMHLSHSVSLEALRGEGEDKLITFYLQQLHAALGERADGYTREAAWRHYNMAVVDYARMVLGCFFKGASPAAFAAKAEQANVGLCYRNVEASLLFVERVDRCLKYVEGERA